MDKTTSISDRDLRLIRGYRDMMQKEAFAYLERGCIGMAEYHRAKRNAAQDILELLNDSDEYDMVEEPPAVARDSNEYESERVRESRREEQTRK